MIKLSQILEQNPWWEKSVVIAEEKWDKRFLYKEIKEQIHSRFIISLLGLRRVGKSTILKQIIAKLLAGKTNPKQILYFSFDQKLITKNEDALEKLLETYFEKILKEKVPFLKNKVFIILDEVQYIDFWQDIIKRYYDLNPKIKFFITGSQSIALLGKSRESLAGRIFEFYLEPLSFAEFALLFKKKKAKNYLKNLFEIENIFGDLEKDNYSMGHYLKKDVTDYLLFGQFPELNKEKDLKNKYQYIKEAVIGKILEIDIPRIFKVNKVSHLKIMAEHLIENSGSLFELNNIGRDIGINRFTCENFFQYFKNGYLLDVLYRYSKSKIKSGRTLKKAYTCSTNFISSLRGMEEDFHEKAPEVFGRVVETFIFNYLKTYCQKSRFDLSFFRKGSKEIDFIIRNENKILPIEVKFKENIRNSDFKFLVDYSVSKKIKKALLVTKDLIKKEKNNEVEIYFIPFYFFI